MRYTEPRLSDNGLVFSLPLRNGFTSGATFWDETQTYTATATNSPTPQYPGFRFTGTSSMFIDIGNGPSSVNTVLMWIKLDDIIGNEYPIDLNGVDYLAVATATLVKGGFAGGTSILYVDAVAAAKTLTANWHLIGVTDTVAKDASDFDVGRVGTSYFDGLISDVRLYNRVLSAEEIRSIYYTQKHRYQT